MGMSTPVEAWPGPLEIGIEALEVGDQRAGKGGESFSDTLHREGRVQLVFNLYDYESRFN